MNAKYSKDTRNNMDILSVGSSSTDSTLGYGMEQVSQEAENRNFIESVIMTIRTDQRSSASINVGCGATCRSGGVSNSSTTTATQPVPARSFLPWSLQLHYGTTAASSKLSSSPQSPPSRQEEEAQGAASGLLWNESFRQEADAFFEDFEFLHDVGLDITDDEVFGDLLEEIVSNP